MPVGTSRLLNWRVAPESGREPGLIGLGRATRATGAPSTLPHCQQVSCSVASWFPAPQCGHFTLGIVFPPEESAYLLLIISVFYLSIPSCLPSPCEGEEDADLTPGPSPS